jgi:RimJ/RimL family protein N-acetyltransferase
LTIKLLESAEVGRSKLLRELERDPVKNLYAIWNLTRDPDNTKLYSRFEGNRMLGYLLQYSGLSHPMAILEAESEEIGSKLMDVLPWKKFAILVSPARYNIVAERYRSIWSCLENELSLTDSPISSVSSEYEPVKIPSTEAEKLLDFYPRQTAGSRSLAGYEKWLSNQTVYGIFVNGKIVCVAGTYIESRHGWMLGGLYTHPRYRGLGLGTTVTSALTIEALKRSQRAIAYVESTNKASLRILEKLGYQKTRDIMFADIGTGVRPLMN